MKYQHKNSLGVKSWVHGLFVITPILALLVLLITSLNRLDSFAIEQNTLSYEINYKAVIDDDHAMSPDRALQLLKDEQELTLNRSVASFGDKSHWYQIEIRNTKQIDRSMVLLLDNPMLDQIDVFGVTEIGPVPISTFGDKFLLTQEKLLTALPRVEFELEQYETAAFLIKSSSLGAPQMPVGLFEKASFERYRDALFMLWGGFTGVVLLMSIYNLILYLGTKEKIYVLYVGYILSFLAVLSFVHGFAAYLFPYALFSFINNNLISFYFLLGCCLLLFTYYFLKFDQSKFGKLKKAVITFNYLLIAGAIFSLFVPEYVAANLFIPMQLILYVLALVMLFLTFKSKDRSSLYYLFSWIPLLIGSAIGTLLLTDGLAYGFWTRHAAFLGVMFEMAFISMALAERLKSSQNETLYVATHNRRYDLPNASLLETKLDTLSLTNSKSLLLIEVKKFEQVIPYLEQQQLISVVEVLCQEFENFFGPRLLISQIDQNNRIALLREGLFALIVESNDNALVRKTLEEFKHFLPIEINVQDFSVSFKCSVGVCDIDLSKGLTVSQLINRAQQAIDIAQQQNQHFYLFDEEAESEEGRKVQIASDLKLAIEKSELQLFHQPQVELETGQVLSSEVLLRWNHPRYGYISPEEFVAIAESTGIITSLTEWVFEEACQHLVTLKDEVSESYKISINVSAFDITQQRFLRFVIKTIRKYDLSAKNIMLELTETVLIDDAEVFDSNIKELKSLGFKIGMDDFGTGYSSLTYVSRHKFDEIKIDKSFIQNLDTKTSDQTIVNATLKMAASLGIKVVAEGIETVQAEEFLKAHNCDIGQGFYYSKPVPLANYLDWLQSN